MSKRGRNKRAQTWETLIPWMIGIAVLVLVLILYFILKNKGVNALDYIKNLLRFGRG